jgi:hypothetical protein
MPTGMMFAYSYWKTAKDAKRFAEALIEKVIGTTQNFATIPKRSIRHVMKSRQRSELSGAKW